ncbi:MAG: hypothetical protein U0T81_09120 [Saprospiraceae bacterium]
MQKLEKQLDKLEEEKRNCLLILVKAVLIILISRLINWLNEIEQRKEETELRWMELADGM